MNGRGPKPTTAGQDSAADWQELDVDAGHSGRIGNPRCPLTGVLRVGTRGSALALAQSGRSPTGWPASPVLPAELVRIRTQGDVNLGPLASIGGTGVFVIEVRSRLLAGDVDVIVHSLKDLPTAPAPGIALAAVPPGRTRPTRCAPATDSRWTRCRVEPWWAPGHRGARPSCSVIGLTWWSRRSAATSTPGWPGQWRVADAVVLAAAGLARLGRTDAMTQRLTADLMLPAPAQGALAVETRASDADDLLVRRCAARDRRRRTRSAVTAERSLLAALEAGCTAPVGAYATVDGQLSLTGAVIAVDGSREVRGSRSGPAGRRRRIGAELAAHLIDDGAAALLAAPS